MKTDKTLQRSTDLSAKEICLRYRELLNAIYKDVRKQAKQDRSK